MAEMGLENNTSTSIVHRLRSQDSSSVQRWSVVGYATAEGYDLPHLAAAVRIEGLYEAVHMTDDLEAHCLLVRGIYNPLDYDEVDPPREIFFFKEGAAIFWNCPKAERIRVLRSLQTFQHGSFDELLIRTESETMKFTLGHQAPTTLANDTFHFNKDHTPLEKYSFSNAIASSVKLGVWESHMDVVATKVDIISRSMREGTRMNMRRKDVFRMFGEVYTLRHKINLSSDLLDTPDFYWDHETLENLYLQTCSHLSMKERISTINERLSYCSAVLELLMSHLNDKHASKLEWYIIMLIVVEVVFETFHFIESLVKWNEHY